MEWHWWSNGTWHTLAALFFALIIWFSREPFSKHPWLWYLRPAGALLFAIAGVAGDLDDAGRFSNIPLIFRVLRYLILTLLVIVALVSLARKKT